MTAWKPKLQFIHRVLILISVPLLFQATFIVILQSQIKQEKLKQRRLIQHLESMNNEVPQALQSSSAAAQNRLQELLALGITANVILCVLLVLYFSQNMVRRLNTLMGNSQRLAAGKALSPPLEGDDEIARLDKVFHTMANTIEESRQRELGMLRSVQESESRLRELMENLPVGLVSLTADGKIEFANTTLQKIFGYQQSELAGNPLSMILPGGAPAQTGTTETVQIVVKDGSLKFVDVLSTRFESDEHVRTLLSIQDVSAREHAERLKKDFLNMISHDLRTPLNAVQATLGNLSEGIYGELPETGRIKTEQAEKDIKRLINLTNELLELERLKAGKLPLRVRPTSVQHLINRSLESVYSFAELSGVSIISNEERNGSTVDVDEERIVQVLVNLLTNAIKFSSPNKSVSLKAEERDGQLKLNVTDCGTGISCDSLKLIFEPFQQAGSSPDLKGSGLGLAICKSIISQHDGEIGVTSEIGKGSTFWISIPLNQRERGSAEHSHV